MEQGKDVERGETSSNQEELEQPFIRRRKVVAHEDDGSGKEFQNESIGMVLLSTGVAVCGSFQFGICVGYSAPTQSAIRKDLNLSLAEAMRVSSVICIVAWLAIYFSQGALSLDTGRFLTGYGIAAFSYVLFIVTGGSFAFIVGTIINWRALALIATVPCLILLLGVCFVPESPRWLAKVGRDKEFEVALQKLRGNNADISDEMTEIQEYIATLNSLPKASILDLFQSRNILAVIIGVGLMVFQQFAGINGVQFYASETFESAGVSSKIGTIAYACLQVPITLVGALLMDKTGRRVLVMVSAAGMFVGCMLAGTSFSLKGQGLLLDWVPIIAVSGVLIYVAFFSIGMGAGPWVIMSEIFPIDIKGVGGSLVVLVNWSGAWIVSYTYNFLMRWSSPGTYFLYSAVCLLTILFVAKIVPETKGKTLEEIQASLNPDRRQST
ncbi:hypothetical protein Pyn_29927 [Prunus yedoensis var. nudiflora]|uniref:Major facilitator superfamily (MFS) profile domain-containing protein n=1 Tax=Prunus yedoensis var. nudiflora TaxID=2094558 RepID=A0A314YVU5_PRUYE|nr:hypothetical protein Pyn_29927 [Prunus yedoensis var. nudiflora]